MTRTPYPVDEFSVREQIILSLTGAVANLALLRKSDRRTHLRDVAVESGLRFLLMLALPPR